MHSKGQWHHQSERNAQSLVALVVVQSRPFLLTIVGIHHLLATSLIFSVRSSRGYFSAKQEQRVANAARELCHTMYDRVAVESSTARRPGRHTQRRASANTCGVDQAAALVFVLVCNTSVSNSVTTH
eukprot:COSAG06_NODE_6118_length_3100_cov_3.380746_2_plen_127_part_00